MKHLLISLLLLAVSLTLGAQSIKLDKRFGKVSESEVLMSGYEADTSAVALVLYQSNETSVEITPSGELSQYRKKHIRIKVLKEAGKDYGSVSILCSRHLANQESVSGVEVIVFNSDGSKIKSVKLPRKSVFKEEVTEDLVKYSWSASEVKVGSVIEMRWMETSSRYWDIGTIYFQRELPVNMSEVLVRVPDIFTFNKKVMGYHHVDVSSEKEAVRYELTADATYGYNEDLFLAYDIPAVKDESFIYNIDQYCSSVRYDVSSLYISGAVYEDYSTTWEKVDLAYRESRIFSTINAPCRLKDEMDALMSGWSDETEAKKLASILDLVRSRVMWNDNLAIIPEPAASVLKAQSGNNADINSIAATCLKYAGYQVDPVLIKLRSSGELLDYQPEMNAFDTFILRIRDKEGNQYYVESANPCAYLNVLPDNYLVTNARLLEKSEASWVDLTSLSQNIHRMQLVASVGVDGVMTGNITDIQTNTEALDVKESVKDLDAEDMIGAIENALGADVDEHSITGINEYSGVVQEKYSFTKVLDKAGDMIYVNPFIMSFHNINSFKEPERIYPLDFHHPYTITYVCSLTMPEGYVAEQLPENVSLQMPELGGALRLIVNQQDRTIRVNYTFTQSALWAPASAYAQLRSYWETLAKVYGSTIVLKKEAGI